MLPLFQGKKQQNETKHHRSNFLTPQFQDCTFSHLSIIYRRPQRAVAELVRAGGSKLGSRRRGGSRWSVVVRMLVLKASRRVGGGGSCYSVLVVVVVEDFRVGVPSSPGLVTCQSRDAGGQDRWQQPHRVSGCGPNVLFSKFSMDGAFEWKRNFSQSPSWMVVVVVVVVRGGAGGVFSLLTMEDQTAEHLVSCQESPRPWPRPLGDGERHENSWTPGKLWPVPTGLAASASVCGNVGSGAGGCGHPGNAREPSGLGRQDPASSLGPKTCTTQALQELPWDGKARGHRPRDDRGPVHFLWTWTLAYSE